MADTLDKVAERLARLEVTVAEGFHHAEMRDSALSRKIDINTESLRADFQSLIEVVTANTEESRGTAAAMRTEHAAERELLKLSLEQHTQRLHDLERP